MWRIAPRRIAVKVGTIRLTGVRVADAFEIGPLEDREMAIQGSVPNIGPGAVSWFFPENT
jgi:hypothetical protein